jgi:hypothetical protein
LVEYHAGRDVGSTLAWLAYKAGFLSRCAAAYGAAAAVAAAMAVWVWLRGGRPTAAADQGKAGCEAGYEAAVWGAVGLVSAVHIMAPFPYDDYQAIVYPLLAAVLAARLIRMATIDEASATQRARWAALAVAAVCALEAGSSPMAWQWAIGERDRIWWPMREQTPLARLQEAGRRVRALAQEAGGRVLLTQDTYLAVEAGLDVPPGMELGPFCYFPDWPDAKARACHVLNRRGMEETLAGTDAPVAAFSGYGLAIRGPDVAALAPEQQAALWDIVRRRYEPAAVIERFGQASTRLEILTARRPPM